MVLLGERAREAWRHELASRSGRLRDLPDPVRSGGRDAERPDLLGDMSSGETPTIDQSLGDSLMRPSG